jgi:hypothetical protein
MLSVQRIWKKNLPLQPSATLSDTLAATLAKEPYFYWTFALLLDVIIWLWFFGPTGVDSRRGFSGFASARIRIYPADYTGSGGPPTRRHHQLPVLDKWHRRSQKVQG